MAITPNAHIRTPCLTMRYTVVNYVLLNHTITQHFNSGNAAHKTEVKEKNTHFLPRDAMHSAVFVVVRCPSVCLSR